MSHAGVEHYRGFSIEFDPRTNDDRSWYAFFNLRPPLQGDGSCQVGGVYKSKDEAVAAALRGARGMIDRHLSEPKDTVQKFERYEDVAVFLLNRYKQHFGLSEVQARQLVAGAKAKRGWQLEGKGVRMEDGAIIVVECKSGQSRQKQEDIRGLAYRINDVGAAGAILVTAVPLQDGAKALVLGEGNITHVMLEPGSTETDYMIQFLERTMAGRAVSWGAVAGDAFGAGARTAAGDIVRGSNED